MVADRAILERRVRTIVASVRDRIDTEEDRLRDRKLAALGEFAGGSGHELNNPLAVIVGRAQLLLARTDDPETVRSLRIILSQAGRAHRILRDLMFVARPPVAAAANVPAGGSLARMPARYSRGMRRPGHSSGERDRRIAGRSLISIPTGCGISPRSCCATRFKRRLPAARLSSRASVQGDELSWSFNDSGTGIAPHEAAHLFDPFFCGRQAGRGLGLGLPRAARLVDQAGGRLRWSSSPGHGSVFQVHLPLVPIGRTA